jgi:glutamyl-tRNA reductase
LVALQRGLPLVSRPFERLGADVGMEESAVLARVRALFEDGSIRRLGAVFDPRGLGYASVLCAVAADPLNVEPLVPGIVARASVTHCYLRELGAALAPSNAADDGETVPNVWFTVTAKAEALDAEIAGLRAIAAPRALLVLPATSRFKIGVVLQPSSTAPRSAERGAPHPSEAAALQPLGPLDARERRLVRRLQDNLPLVPMPFEALADETDWPGTELLERLQRWEAAGALRRVGAIFRHRQMGFTANGMCAWRASADHVACAAPLLAGHPAVSHCYERAVVPGFPYNLYAMVHGRDRREVEDVFHGVSEQAGLKEGVVLYSVTEYKKTSPRFFEDDPALAASAAAPIRPARGFFPASLLVDGRTCLVVGAGKIALHKVRLLLDARARVVVVAPESLAEIQALSQAGQIRHLSRDFTEADVEGAFLVVAATSDKQANRRVLAACRDRNVLSCSVDGNWSDGDFVTPAILRKDGLTVAISTGGSSCRRSRLVKEALARQFDVAESAQLTVVGASHEGLSVSEREQLHLTGERLAETGGMVAQANGVHEFMLLNTCNRVELIGVTAGQEGQDRLLKRILGFDRFAPAGCYVKRGVEAFAHLSELSAGLLSQMMGENHIVAQIKEALEYGVRAGWARGALREWVAAAMHISKDIRQAVGPLLSGHDVEDFCVQYLQTAAPVSDGGRVMVIGSGKVGSGLIPRLAAMGYACEWCFHTSEPQVPEGIHANVRTLPWAELHGGLAHANAVVCAVACSEPVFTREHSAYFRKDAPVTVLDVAIPRNVAPELAEQTANLTLVNLDDLKHLCRRETGDLSRIRQISTQTIGEHADLYERLVDGLFTFNAPRFTPL